jgi:putative transposase
VPCGSRKRVAYENPAGRRVNVLAALIPDGTARALYWLRQRGSITAAQFLAFLPTIPRPTDQPLVLVLDNGSIHVSHLISDARAELRRRGIYLYFLPPYSPQLNRIEPVFKAIKHYDLPARRYSSWTALEDAIDTAFGHYHERLTKSGNHPGKAA